MIRPLLKCNLKRPSESGNYRPIAITNSASKLIEDLLLEKLEGYVQRAIISSVSNLNIQLMCA